MLISSKSPLCDYFRASRTNRYCGDWVLHVVLPLTSCDFCSQILCVYERSIGVFFFFEGFFYIECAEIYNLFFICGQVLRERRKITLVTEFKSFFSEILAALNLRGSPVRLTEVELRCEVFYVASFKLI